ncbi:SCO family protein [Bartonella sp. W8125]|uniref:SCO family protein n=1 Tax=Bartonella TaxID=773 RepID=UPI0018DE444B|nr:SCO family protein [Bartonella choladocola]MBI0140969.1 SCO family protein [Bartonella choladocola]
MRRESKKAALSAFYIVLSVALLWRFYFIGNLVPFRRGLRISALPIPTEKQSLRQTLKKPSAIFFGYTMFPDICAAMFTSIENRGKELGPDADKPDFRFITVNPEQDIPKVLRDYLSKFTDKITGISGEPPKIHELVSSFNIGAKKGSQLSGRTSVIISEEKVPKISICSLYMSVVGRLKSLANNRSL